MSSLPLPLAVFFAGMISFVSPCVLPLVPGYISLISEAGVEELSSHGPVLTRKTVLHCAMFVAGFTAIFLSLGAIASELGQLVAAHIHFLSKIAGLIIIVFGLHASGLLPLRFLYRYKRIEHLPNTGKMTRSFLVGAAFGFGWTPCVGPVLATVLAFAASTENLKRGVALLALYSLGLALPFLLTALGIDRFLVVYRAMRGHLHAVEVLSGWIMVAAGVLIFTRHFAVLNAWMYRLPLFREIAEKFL